MRGAAIVVVGALVAGGCGGSEACADLGDQILLTAQVTDNGERTRVEVELRRDEHGAEAIPVKLCEDNALRVDDVVMTQVKRPTGAVVYEAELTTVSGDAALARRFQLESEGGTSEFTAAIEAPGFTITAPTAGSEVSRAAALAITWSPARGGDATMAVKLADEIDGDACLGEPVELEEPDDGEVVLGEAMVELSKEPPSDGMCAAFLSLARTHSATLERTQGGYELHPDSRVLATTSRTVAFVSVP